MLSENQIVSVSGRFPIEADVEHFILDCSTKDINSTEIKYLFARLEKNCTIKSITIQNSALGIEILEVVAGLLQKSRSLERIDFSTCKISELKNYETVVNDELKKIAEALFYNTDLVSLSLCFFNGILTNTSIKASIEKIEVIIKRNIFFKNLEDEKYHASMMEEIIHKSSDNFNKNCFLTPKKIEALLDDTEINRSENSFIVNKSDFSNFIFKNLSEIEIQKSTSTSKLQKLFNNANGGLYPNIRIAKLERPFPFRGDREENKIDSALKLFIIKFTKVWNKNRENLTENEKIYVTNIDKVINIFRNIILLTHRTYNEELINQYENLVENRHKLYSRVPLYQDKDISDYLNKFKKQVEESDIDSVNYNGILAIAKKYNIDLKQRMGYQSTSRKLSPTKSIFYHAIAQVPVSNDNTEIPISWFDLCFRDVNDLTYGSLIKSNIWSVAQTAIQKGCNAVFTPDYMHKKNNLCKNEANTFNYSILTHLLNNDPNITSIGDFCAGWLDRLTSVILASKNSDKTLSYYGTDPQYIETDMQKKLVRLKNFFKIYQNNNNIPQTQINISALAAQNAEQDPGFKTQCFDLVFTCPPYVGGTHGGKELYRNGASDQTWSTCPNEFQLAQETYKMAHVFYNKIRQNGQLMIVYHVAKTTIDNQIRLNKNMTQFSVEYPGFEFYRVLLEKFGAPVSISSLKVNNGPAETLLTFIKHEKLSQEITPYLIENTNSHKELKTNNYQKKQQEKNRFFSPIIETHSLKRKRDDNDDELDQLNPHYKEFNF